MDLLRKHCLCSYFLPITWLQFTLEWRTREGGDWKSGGGGRVPERHSWTPLNVGLGSYEGIQQRWADLPQPKEWLLPLSFYRTSSLLLTWSLFPWVGSENSLLKCWKELPHVAVVPPEAFNSEELFLSQAISCLRDGIGREIELWGKKERKENQRFPDLDMLEPKKYWHSFSPRFQILI